MKKAIVIVNENDKVIGSKERSLAHPQNDIYRVSALWVTNAQGEILIAQRKLTKEREPGKWGPAVAGTVEVGETYESNIYKEALEEIGLKDRVFALGPKQRRYEPRNHFTQWYLVTIDEPESFFIPQDDEVERVAWIAFDELSLDVLNHPEKYVPSMPSIMEIFSKGI